jgi:hypothetical protein
MTAPERHGNVRRTFHRLVVFLSFFFFFLEKKKQKNPGFGYFPTSLGLTPLKICRLLTLQA